MYYEGIQENFNREQTTNGQEGLENHDTIQVSILLLSLICFTIKK